MDVREGGERWPTAYFAFDGLELTDLDAVSDLGTGQALSSFQQLPGGQFYDNYGSQDSPQGIRPISFSGLIQDKSSAANRVTALDNLRAKIGTRGKLTILLDDDSMRWQWARLTDVITPRSSRDVYWLPFDLQFITAAQMWFGVVTTSAEWTLGDLTWTLGDGTAELGESGVSTTLTATGATIAGLTVSVAGTQQTLTLTNGGNRVATNLAITVTRGASDDIHDIHWSNATSGYSWGYSPSGDLTAGESVTINMGAMSVEHSVDGDDYADFTPSNHAIWDQLAVGDNTITISVDGNESQDATITVEFYDHYK